MLREAIVEGELAPGEKLLPERELARRLGVNRVTVRSALSRLAVGRLLEVRQGSGHRVRDFMRHGGLELVPLLLGPEPRRKKVREVARDLLLIRRTLLRLVIERAAEEAKRKHRDRLSQAISDLTTAEDPTQLPVLERIVIDSIMDAARSPVLTLGLNPILALVDQIPGLEEAIAREPRGNLDAYRILLSGLQGRRGDWIDEVVAELARRDLMVLSHLR